MERGSEQFWAELGQGEAERTVKRLMDWAEDSGLTGRTGPGRLKGPAWGPRDHRLPGNSLLFGIRARTHEVEIAARYLQSQTLRVFNHKKDGEELIRRILDIDHRVRRKREGFPGIDLSVLAEKDPFNRFREVMDWVLGELRQAHAPGALAKAPREVRSRREEPEVRSIETISCPRPDIPRGRAPGVHPLVKDPDALERGTRGHEETRQKLWDWVAKLKIRPLELRPGPAVDMAWRYGRDLYIAEVKSLTGVNETAQIRLGLGQVLDYKCQCEERGNWKKVLPSLVLEMEPQASRWEKLCHSYGVVLAWPGQLARLLPENGS